MFKTERLQILNMIQDGTITADEGAKLLEAIEVDSESKIDSLGNNKAKWIKIKILDADENTKVNVTLPISLINVGVKLATKFSPEFEEAGLNEDDMGEIFDAIKNNETGKIIDIESDDGQKVEIVIY